MTTVLVVDDMAMCREPIAEALEGRGYTVLRAGGGHEALEILQRQHADVVLLDVSMPDPNGLAVLGVIRRNPHLRSLPVILLTERSEREIVAEAVKLGVQGYLLKSQATLDELVKRVQDCVKARRAPSPLASAHHKTTSANQSRTAGGGQDGAATVDGRVPKRNALPVSEPVVFARDMADWSGISPVVSEDQIKKLIDDSLSLKPLAATVQSVMAVTGSAGCSANDVAKVVAHDQALCIRLLRIANSTAYSRGRPVESIQTAVQRIGVQEVRSLVMTLGVAEHYVAHAGVRIDLRLFWEHSIACGLIAAAVARECRYPSPDDCFLWGTVHDVGRLIMLDHLSQEYEAVCETAQTRALPLEEVEPKLIGIDHCEILRHALANWKFQRDFIVPVVNHHRSVKQLEKLGSNHSKAARIIALADRLAHTELLGSSGNDVVYRTDELVESLDITKEALGALLEAIPKETQNLKYVMLSHSSDCEWPDYGAELREKLGGGFCPLFVTKSKAHNALGVFVERIAPDRSSQEANLGILHVRSEAEAPAVLAEFERLESEAGRCDLPVIVVSETEPHELIAVFRRRKSAILSMPLIIERFVTAAAALLGSDHGESRGGSDRSEENDLVGVNCNGKD